jgi:hypothetical protein
LLPSLVSGVRFQSSLSPSRPKSGFQRVQKSPRLIRMSNKNHNDQEQETEKGFAQRAIEVLQTPITLPIPTFIASLVLGGVTITAGVFVSIYLLVSSPDQPEIAINVIPTENQQVQEKQQGEPKLSEAQKDTIIFNQILSGNVRNRSMQVAPYHFIGRPWFFAF